MIRLLIIFAIVFWVIRSVFRFLSAGLGSAQEQRNFSGNRNYQGSRKTSKGDINIEYAPKKKSKKSSDNFKGGDYVDYEEVD